MDNFELEPSMVAVIDGMNEELRVVQEEKDWLKNEYDRLYKERIRQTHYKFIAHHIIPDFIKMGLSNIVQLFYDFNSWHDIDLDDLKHIVNIYKVFEMKWVKPKEKQELRDIFYKEYLHMDKPKDNYVNKCEGILYRVPLYSWEICNEQYLREQYIKHFSAEEFEASVEDSIGKIITALHFDLDWDIVPLKDADNNYIIKDNN